MKKIIFKENTLYSNEYEDIYYNPEYGLEESSFVFIEAINLTETLKKREDQQASLLEMGMGTGLNLLLTWKKIEEIGWKGEFLYFSIEGFPLSKEILKKVYEKPAFEKLKPLSTLFLDSYPNNPKEGVYEISLSPSFKVKLFFYPVEKALSLIKEKFDYFYLDGFNPKTNPEMWSSFVFKKIKEKKKSEAILATFSASRLVKNGLDLAEFKWQRVKGFRNKKHRLIAINE